MLILRLKRAERALADGRLDEAYALAVAEDVRAHRGGQDLIGELARVLVKRGGEHLAAGRVDEASSDGDRALRLAGNLADVAKLREAVTQAKAAARAAAELAAVAVDEARRQVARGQLSVGAGLLEKAPADARADVVREQIEGKRLLVSKLLQRAEAALSRNDWESAVDDVGEAVAAGVKDDRITTLVAELQREAARRMREALAGGNVAAAAWAQRRVSRLGEERAELAEMRGAVALCSAAWNEVAAGRFSVACELLRRVRAVLPAAKWVDEVVADAGSAAGSLERLRCGPLSMLEGVTMPYENGQARPARADKPPVAPMPVVPVSIPRRLLLRIDGVGGFMLVTDGRLNVGGVRDDADLVLPGGGGGALRIERVEDDYFLRAAGSVLVNDRAASAKLLASGDRIAPTPRARLTFRLPSPASTSAVVDFGGIRPPAGDVSRVILLDRELVIGPGAATHVRDDQLAVPVVVYVREGELVARDGGVDTPLRPGAHAKVGELGLVVSML